MMAKMTLGDKDGIRAKIAGRGFVTAQEPACGSGAMVIALAHEMKDAGINYQQHLHVTAIDVDPKCVHMAYLQFALLHIPAIIIHGNTLSLEEFGRWHTPAHIMEVGTGNFAASPKVHTKSNLSPNQSPNGLALMRTGHRSPCSSRCFDLAAA